jgi:acetyltransferase-like isoleucine patch superfamily enzyme
MLMYFIRRHSLRQVWVLFLEEYLGALLRCIPGYEGMFLRWLFCKMTFKRIGKKALIWPSAYITHGYNIVAGDYLAINRGCHIDGRGGITIGNYVLIGPNVFIGSSNHVVSPKDNAPRLLLGHNPEPVHIGNNVWIGANAVICPGVSIGDQSVVGAGSVVTKDVPGSVVVAGSPAHIIKTL